MGRGLRITLALSGKRAGGGGEGGEVLPEYSMFWMEVLTISPENQTNIYVPAMIAGLRIYDDSMNVIDISGATFSSTALSAGVANAATFTDDNTATRIEGTYPENTGNVRDILKVGFVLETPERPAYFGFNSWASGVAYGPDKFKLYAGSAAQVLNGGTVVIDESNHVALANDNPWGQSTSGGGLQWIVVPITYPGGA